MHHLNDKGQSLKNFFDLKKDKIGKQLKVDNKIIKTIYELGNGFNDTAELERKLLDYFASEPLISSALIEIMLKAEEIEKQKISVPVLLLQSRVKLMIIQAF